MATCEEYVVERAKKLEKTCCDLTDENKVLKAKIEELQDAINIIGNIATIKTNEYMHGEKYISIENTYEGTDKYDLLIKLLFPEGNE